MVVVDTLELNANDGLCKAGQLLDKFFELVFLLISSIVFGKNTHGFKGNGTI